MKSKKLVLTCIDLLFLLSLLPRFATSFIIAMITDIYKGFPTNKNVRPNIVVAVKSFEL